MLLAIMIPALNEGETIHNVINTLPKSISGIEEIKIVVVNDGSTDNTEKAAYDAGANYVVNHGKNRGLAAAMATGLMKCLEINADIILTTDADNQYENEEIPKLLEPIMQNKADLVLGDRQVKKLDHMPFGKKYGNIIASKIVSRLCKEKIRDAQTGFRALTKECALKISIMSEYTYTQEMIIQASIHKLRIKEVPITFKKRNDKSRLIKNVFSYAWKTMVTLLRTITFFVPSKTFGYLSLIIIIIGSMIVSRPLIHYFDTGNISPFIPSLLVGSIVLIVGIQTAILAIMSDMSKNNNKIMSETLYLTKKSYIEQKNK